MDLKSCISVGSDVATILGLIALPYLAYILVYKQLQEKWLSGIRDKGTEIILACEKLYALHGRYHDVEQYTVSLVQNGSMTEDGRQAMLNDINSEIIEQKAEIISNIYHIKHHFKDRDPNFNIMKEKIEQLRHSADVLISQNGRLSTQPISSFVEAENKFSSAFVAFLEIYWDKML